MASSRRPIPASCGCEYPICTRVVDVPFSRVPNRKGLYVVKRYMDCLLHGPFWVRMEVVELDEEIAQPGRKV